MDILVTIELQAHQRRLHSKPYVPSTTFGPAMLDAKASTRTVTNGYIGGWNLLPHAVLPYQSGTVHAFGRVTSISWMFCSSYRYTTSFAALLLLLYNKNTYVQPPPATGRFFDITYYLVTNTPRRRRRPSHQTQGDIIAKAWLLFIHSCWQKYWWGIEINCLILYFSNDRKYVAACESILLSLNLPTIAVIYLRISPSPLSSLQNSRQQQLISLCRAHHLGNTDYIH